MKTSTERQGECKRFAASISSLLYADYVTEEAWRSIAANARSIERRAAEQYKRAESLEQWVATMGSDRRGA